MLENFYLKKKKKKEGLSMGMIKEQIRARLVCMFKTENCCLKTFVKIRVGEKIH